MLEFLGAYREHKASRKVRTSLLADYVRAENRSGRLTSWTVVLAGGESGVPAAIPGGQIELVDRRWHLDGDEAARRNQKAELIASNHFRIRRLVNPTDEGLDLTEGERQQALELTRKDWLHSDAVGKEPVRPSGPWLRFVRSPQNGLLILYPVNPKDSPSQRRRGGRYPGVLEVTEKVESAANDVPVVGFAISFPSIEPALASTVRYVVNNVYFEQEVMGGAAHGD